MKKQIRYIILVVSVFLVTSCGTSNSMHHQPDLTAYDKSLPTVKKQSNTVFYSGNNFLLKNKQNLWELYVEGDPLERGLMIGSLSDSLLKKQEYVFFDKINQIVPSNFKKQVLRNFLKWYNRKLYLNVANEYQSEIFGISRYAPKDLDYIAPNFLRDLYLHGAHDIGHAVQDLALVGCTSFAVWGDKSEDGSLILGRNFDFYAGDAFAKDKIVTFIKPKEGHPFMMVTWPGMIGVCSGMNMEGLTVTINAGKSKIPLVAKTPISILTREIIQYASTIDEAVEIAKSKKVFVSESIMVGSAKDNKAVLIEIAPDRLEVFEVNDGNELICSNHFQSEGLKNNERNLKQIKDSHSQYRFDRMTQLLDKSPKITPQIAVDILRNKDGLNDLPLGYGNEKAINQLLSHHGIVFKPAQLLVWVSANPYQMGEFVCYDLNTVFKYRKQNDSIVSLEDEKLNIAKDPFLETTQYKNYELFRIEDRKMDIFLENKKELPENFIANYQSLNPDYWVVYNKVGVYYYQKGEYALAQEQFNKALTKEITTLPQKEAIEKYLKKIKRKLQ
ncbi:C45 family autoproteolytic acyltransferase/hydolase [Flavobacterium sp. N3904]|uniref:C45 family autoproteolytic acyltransferase/hydolase n=1 Tax=Flavobacterium sp. N3904 TaxID=2986835 RepID=UPI00222441B7|nr:C45 family peptidase [Flavobacterium sp. N3904]